METRVEEALKRHRSGYNCAQAVACTYCDLVGIDETTMFRMTEALGLGMGGMEGTCGTVTAVCVLAGLKCSTGNLEQPNSKTETYKLSREAVRQFKDQNTTVVCKVLKGVETGDILRSCPDCVRDAVLIAERVLFAEEG